MQFLTNEIHKEPRDKASSLPVSENQKITTYRLVDTRHLASLILIDFDESDNKFWGKIFTSLRCEDVESSMYRCWKEGKQWKSIFNVDIHVFPLTYLAGINYTRNYSNLESPTWHCNVEEYIFFSIDALFPPRLLNCGSFRVREKKREIRIERYECWRRTNTSTR